MAMSLPIMNGQWYRLRVCGRGNEESAGLIGLVLMGVKVEVNQIEVQEQNVFVEINSARRGITCLPSLML